MRNAERKALHELGLEVGADKAEIKAKFKVLVKRHHPDANSGDRATEDKLREIIQAYNYLKTERRAEINGARAGRAPALKRSQPGSVRRPDRMT